MVRPKISYTNCLVILRKESTIKMTKEVDTVIRTHTWRLGFTCVYWIRWLDNYYPMFLWLIMQSNCIACEIITGPHSVCHFWLVDVGNMYVGLELEILRYNQQPSLWRTGGKKDEVTSMEHWVRECGYNKQDAYFWCLTASCTWPHLALPLLAHPWYHWPVSPGLRMLTSSCTLCQG